MKDSKNSSYRKNLSGIAWVDTSFLVTDPQWKGPFSYETHRSCRGRMLLRRQPEIEGGDRVGIDHLGFKVDDVHETLSALKHCGGEAITDPVSVIPTDPSHAQSYYEIKCVGPDGQVNRCVRLWLGRHSLSHTNDTTPSPTSITG
jgi:hypothetical protein